MKMIFRAAALLAALVPFVPAAAQTGGGIAGHGSAVAETFVGDNITKSLVILNNPGLSAPQRSQQFEAILLGMTDTRRVATFTLGPFARTASPSDQDAFAGAYQAYSVAVYRSYFGRFSGQSLAVTGSSQRAPGDFIVATKLTDPHDHSGQAPLEVDFRVRTDAGKPVVTDLSIAGMWLVLSQHDQFVSYLNAHGGSIPNLTAYVMQVTAQLAKPAPAR